SQDSVYVMALGAPSREGPHEYACKRLGMLRQNNQASNIWEAGGARSLSDDTTAQGGGINSGERVHWPCDGNSNCFLHGQIGSAYPPGRPASHNVHRWLASHCTRVFGNAPTSLGNEWVTRNIWPPRRPGDLADSGQYPAHCWSSGRRRGGRPRTSPPAWLSSAADRPAWPAGRARA